MDTSLGLVVPLHAAAAKAVCLSVFGVYPPTLHMPIFPGTVITSTRIAMVVLESLYCYSAPLTIFSLCYRLGLDFALSSRQFH